MNTKSAAPTAKGARMQCSKENAAEDLRVITN